MVFASVVHFSLDVKNPRNTPGGSTAMVVFACLFITGFAMIWGPMVWAIVAELYLSCYRLKLALELLDWVLHSIHHE
ncbi:hypothetical protein N7495_004574 [Penicillium taxi]|uniref:uncharacterized protein n=1 Tax=Penicillium taxi TaxID=168475 RepID=UPI002544EC24|nr:uncharacterized protein N7495_004574 [Penicillium taxi]KAJ5899830.1 hypothetical protein N7495_004574 [Penicillium taxi]